MKFILTSHLPEEVRESIKSFMETLDLDDSNITRLYCFYNSETETYTHYTLNPDELISDIDFSFKDEVYIIELDLCDYYINILKDIVKDEYYCKFNKIQHFNLIAKNLMNYGNEQVLNLNYPLYKYLDIFKLIFKLREVME